MKMVRLIALVLTMLPVAGHSTLIYTMDPQPELSGTFRFDPLSAIYTNVALQGTRYGFTDYFTTPVMSGASVLNSVGNVFNSLLQLNFTVALGAEVPGESIVFDYNAQTAAGTFTGTGLVKGSLIPKTKFRFTVDPAPELSGSFGFDALSMTFLDVVLQGTRFGFTDYFTTPTALSNDSSLRSVGNNYSSQLNLRFADPLWSVVPGNTIDFTYDVATALGPFSGTGFVTAAAVPIPGTLGLLGVGLAALGMSRRKKA